MRRIIVSFLTIFAVVVMVAGGTTAVFSDTESIEDNTVATGTLDLTLNESEGKPFSISDAYPGYVSGWEYMDVFNTGSLPFEAELSVAQTSGDAALWAVLTLEMETAGGDGICATDDFSENTIYSGLASGFPNGITASDIAYWHLANEDDASGGPDNIRAGWSERICQRVGVDSSAGNEVQGTSVTFTETVDAVQDND